MTISESDIEKAVQDGLGSAMQVIYEQTDDENRVEWTDVSDSISSGDWGRLIQQGILSETTDGAYKLENRDTVIGAVRSESEVVDHELDDIEIDATWTRADKIAALIAGIWVTGYTVKPVRDIITTVLDPFLGTLASILPMYVVIFLLAAVTGIWSLYIRSRLVDMENVNKIQEKLQDVQPDKDELTSTESSQSKEMQSKVMSKQLDMMKAQFRPMGWISAGSFPAFIWLYSVLVFADGSYGTVIFPLFGQVAWTATIIGPIQAWILWYGICSVAVGQLFDKMLGFTTSN